MRGGAYYALGLIHANKGWTDDGKMVDFLLEKLKGTRNPTILHGACLGLSCAAMASGSAQISDALSNALHNLDDAVAGEAAAYGLGLLNAGRGSDAASEIERMLSYAHETTHEKIIRGLSLGVGLIMYGHEEVADALIEQMIRDKDHIIRYGGCFAVAMAYCGTSNNAAVGRLLHVAVSDVSPNVRRAAVMSLGFVMIREPEKMPQLVSLLSISYCPHVRYGACLAVGVACAGSAHQGAIDMLRPMMKDKVDFVRQGAFIAMAMVLMEESPAACPALGTVREEAFRGRRKQASAYDGQNGCHARSRYSECRRAQRAHRTSLERWISEDGVRDRTDAVPSVLVLVSAHAFHEPEFHAHGPHRSRSRNAHARQFHRNVQRKGVALRVLGSLGGEEGREEGAHCHSRALDDRESARASTCWTVSEATTGVRRRRRRRRNPPTRSQTWT